MDSAGTARDALSAAMVERVQGLRLPPPPANAGINASTSIAWLIATLSISGFVFIFLFAFVYQVGGPRGGNSGNPPASTTIAGDGKTTTAGSKKDPTAPAKNDTRPVDSATVDPEAMVLLSQGYIIPEQQILVSPQVSGRIIELNVKEGTRVEKGFVLAKLEPTEYRADYEGARANVAAAEARLAELREGNRPEEIAQAQAELGEAKATLKQLEQTFRRNAELYGQKILNKQEFEDSESQLMAQAQRVLKLEAMVKLAEDGFRKERKLEGEANLHKAMAELERAKWRLDNCTIVAPISGTILKKNAEEGNIVNPVAFNGSFSLCDLADLSKLEVDLTIQERDISKVFPGQKCKVRSEAFPDRAYDGVVSRLMPIADRAKGAIPVRVAISVPADEEGMYLKPEMSAQVTFYAGKAETKPATMSAE
ncbi:HlyD family secretion protein [Planctopirus hydrillae]|uniref:Secretion protein HlyD n=1 Tax=Planctopirus hydrillae TaxID=1841610 RepID=A0A1C3E4T7_9PLAN|nr:efflux RND transporter periplasmic adaptor subunit [Planctopirus hydrillae]ODA28272.1 secretion protein HlyD [Planctopirus hydrillae]